MTIIKNKEYCTVSTAMINDERLSWAARGIMAYISSLEDEYIDVDELIKTRPGGAIEEEVIRLAIEELKEYGYVTSVRMTGVEDG